MTSKRGKVAKQQEAGIEKRKIIGCVDITHEKRSKILNYSNVRATKSLFYQLWLNYICIFLDGFIMYNAIALQLPEWSQWQQFVKRTSLVWVTPEVQQQAGKQYSHGYRLPFYSSYWLKVGRLFENARVFVLWYWLLNAPIATVILVISNSGSNCAPLFFRYNHLQTQFFFLPHCLLELIIFIHLITNPSCKRKVWFWSLPVNNNEKKVCAKWTGTNTTSLTTTD